MVGGGLVGGGLVGLGGLPGFSVAVDTGVSTILVGATVPVAVRTIRMGVRVRVGVFVLVAVGDEVGVFVGVIEMIKMGVAVGASVADGGAGVGVISEMTCSG